MRLPLVALALATAAALAGAVPAHARPDIPESPVKLVQQPRPCPSGYSETGYVGPEGARWSICQR